MATAALHADERGTKRTQVGPRALRWIDSLLACTVTITSLAGVAHARTWRITAEGSGDAPTIQAGIDSAATGDSILVAPGVYYENLDTKGKGLTLRSVGGPEVTIIDGAGTGRVLRLDSGGAVVGLTLRNGSVYEADGGGIFLVGSGPIVVRGNTIEYNSAEPGAGGGLHLDGTITADVLIESNIIRGNTASIGGGLLVSDNLGSASPVRIYIRHNVIDSNAAGDRGGGIQFHRARVTENIIARNFALLHGGGVDCSGLDSDLSGNTVAYNRTANPSDNGAGIIVVGPGVTVINNLIVGNHSDAFTPRGAGIDCRGSVPRCNVLWQNDVDLNECTSDPSNSSQDPEFCAVDPMESLSFLIQRDSPCAPNENTCGLIGAQPVGCGTTSVIPKMWGEVKRLYR